jgi:enoyl-CoA hydratase/carnithine racemase
MPAEYGLSWMLPRLVGLTHSADLLLSGRIVLAEELGAMGFFNRVFAPADFEAGVADYARTLAGLSPEAVKTTKRQLYEDLLGADPGASVERSKVLIGELMAMPDYAEGVRALMEKRAPRFGR